MKDYNLLFDKGIKYNRLALENWDVRRSKLEALSVHPKHILNKSRYQKIMHLLSEIEERTEQVIKFLRWASTTRLEEHLQALQSTITLICISRSCQSRKSLQKFIVPLKSYVPGKKRCNLCGQPLVTEDDVSIDKMLGELGISISEE